MKKYAITAVLLSCLFLYACGTSSQNTNSRNAASSDASVSESAINYPTFGGSATFCAQAIGTSLEEGGTYNAFADEPKVLDQSSDIFGEIRCYSYPVCTGVYAMLYENRDAELCYQLSLSINWSEVNAWDNSVNLISDYTVILLLAAEQDYDKVEAIASELGLLSMGDAYADTNMTAESDSASYSYTTQNKFTMLNVIAK